MDFNALFGKTHDDLTMLQMTCRAVVIFFIAFILLRIAGVRTFGKTSAFDVVLSILLGAILSRAVTAASPFWATVAAAAVLVLLHRLFAILSASSRFFSSFLEGRHRELYDGKNINRKNLKRSSLSDADLMQGIREMANTDSLDGIEKVYLENDGKITVIKKKQ